MISQAMQIFRDVLQESLQTQWSDGPIRVRMGRVKDPDPGGDVSLVLSLVNLSVEGDRPPAPPGTPPPLRMSVLLSASPTLGYATGLQLLSNALHIFHMTPVLTPQATPHLADRFARIAITPVSLDLEDLRGVWSLQGAPYQPSMVYELNAVPLNVQPAASWVQPTPVRVDAPR